MTASKRKGLSKRLRFEIFKRDGFRCLYCGVTPVQGLLRVDHVKPVASGGTDAPDNLVTSCFDCNAGKSDIPLDRRTHAPRRSADDAEEHAAQMKAYLAAQREIADAREELVGLAESHWADVVGWTVSARERASLKTFLRELDLQEVLRCIDIASTRVQASTEYQAGRCFAYFCGICWRKIKESRSRDLAPETGESDTDVASPPKDEGPDLSWEEFGLGSPMNRATVSKVADLARSVSGLWLRFSANEVALLSTLDHQNKTTFRSICQSIAQDAGVDWVDLPLGDHSSPSTTPLFDTQAIRLLLRRDDGAPHVLSIPWRAVRHLYERPDHQILRWWVLSPKSFVAMLVEGSQLEDR